MKINLCKKLKRGADRYKLGEFFRNFIAVILGIVITFMGNDIISGHNTQKEIKESLELVKSELLLNKEQVKYLGEKVAAEQRGALYMLAYKDKLNEISPDSLSEYFPLLFQWSTYKFMDDAMEMLKTSALIPKIKDKKLAVQIIKVYNEIESCKFFYEMYVKHKERVLDQYNAGPAVKKYVNDMIRKGRWDDKSGQYLSEMFRFTVTQPEGLELLRTIPNIQKPDKYFFCSEMIDETIEAIDQAYHFN